MQLTSLIALLPLYLSLATTSTAQTLNNITYNGIGSTPSQRHTISASQAQILISAAESYAASLNVSDNIAVVDPSGLLVAFLRMDNAFPGGIDLATKKARTVVLFNGLTSELLYPAVLPTGTLYGLEETNGGLVVFPGGLPIYKDGYLLGGFGVSGGTIEQDAAVAQKGIDGLVV